MHSAPTRLTSSPPQSPPQQAWARDARRGRRARIRLFGAGVSKHTVLIALSAMFALPLVWMVGTSVKTAGQALQLVRKFSGGHIGRTAIDERQIRRASREVAESVARG